MPQSKRRRGFKACDPFCRDKVRKALYNRPNGPHMGKIVMGKTYLSGIDGKCFSRTGRIKRGYRNVPIDLEREFEIEKRQIKQIQNMIRGPSDKQKARKAAKKKQQKLEYEQRKAKHLSLQQQQNTDTSTNETNRETNRETCTPSEKKTIDTKTKTIDTKTKTDQNNSIAHQKENDIEMKSSDITSAKKPMIMGQEIQKMDKLSRMPNETFLSYIYRVKKTASYFLNEKKHRQLQAKLRRRQRNHEKKLRREERKIETKRLLKLEQKKQRKEQRAFERKIKPKKEYIPFGATNERPPVDLHKLGAELFGKRVQNKNNRNVNNLNVGSLSFANVIKGRAQQMKRDEVRRNYAVMKQRRYAQMKKKQNKSKRKVW